MSKSRGKVEPVELIMFLSQMECGDITTLKCVGLMSATAGYPYITVWKPALAEGRPRKTTKITGKYKENVAGSQPVGLAFLGNIKSGVAE